MTVWLRWQPAVLPQAVRSVCQTALASHDANEEGGRGDGRNESDTKSNDKERRGLAPVPWLMIPAEVTFTASPAAGTHENATTTLKTREARVSGSGRPPPAWEIFRHEALKGN